MTKKDERTIWQVRLPLSVKIAGKALADKLGIPEGDLVAEAVRRMVKEAKCGRA